jgi:hypothetical protein
MSEQIKDGTGAGYLAKVDSDKKLHTRSVIDTEEFQANREGNAYNLNTGIINLTNATRTSVIYLKNNEENDLVISAVAIGAFNSANGDGLDMTAIFVRNPTTGDIISGTNVDINSNRNYGSSNTLTADVKKGASGDTAVNGDDHIIVRISEQSRSFISINERLPKGTSFAVDITPPTGNDGMNLYVAIICYIDSQEV